MRTVLPIFQMARAGIRDLLKFNDHKSVIIIKDISTTFEF